MIVDKRRLRQRRAGRRLHRVYGDVFSVNLVIYERERQAGEVAAAAGAPNNDVRVVAYFFKLFFCLKTDDGLV